MFNALKYNFIQATSATNLFDSKLLMQLLYHGELPTRLDLLHGQRDPIFPTVLG